LHILETGSTKVTLSAPARLRTERSNKTSVFLGLLRELSPKRQAQFNTNLLLKKEPGGNNMNPINQIQTPFIQGLTNPIAKPENKVEGFGEIFKQAIQNVNEAQQASDKLTTGLATGQVDNIHEVMIASEKASISLELT